MLVGMASKISECYTYKCVDRSRHIKNGYESENCLPLRLGNCANTVHTQLSHSAPAPAVSTTSVPAFASAQGSVSTMNLDLKPTPDSLRNSDHHEIPPFEPLSEPVFSWGEYSVSQFCDALNSLFKVLYGKAGKEKVGAN